MSTKQNLTSALELLRATSWVKGSFTHSRDGNVIGYCSAGAVGAIRGTDSPTLANAETRLLERAISALGYGDPARCSIEGCTCDASDTTVIKFNDAPATLFSDVERVFAKAIELAGQDETR